MATNTEKLGLKKPSQEDFYNVEDFNENFQKIDDFASRKDNPHDVTAEQTGAVKKSGDTMTGALVAPKLVLTNYDEALEVGRFIDMHLNGSNADFDGRLHLAPDGSLLYSKQAGINYEVMHSGNLATHGVAKIATGSYTGTNMAGTKNRNTLTFDFAPKLVLIQYTDGCMAMVNGCAHTKLVGVSVSTDACNVIWNGNSVTWWSAGENVTAQCNNPSYTYYYIAIS